MISQGTRLDVTADRILSGHMRRQQGEEAGIRSAGFGKWRHFSKRDFQ